MKIIKKGLQLISSFNSSLSPKTHAVEHKKVVKADPTVENNTPTRSAKELGKEYIEDLKQAYEDKRIEVHVIQKGKIIATIKRQPIF